MVNTQLLKYIKSILDDNYAMEVLYYCIRRAVADNDYSLTNLTSFRISSQYHKESVTININHRFNGRLDALAMIMSVRALMLNHEYINCCEDDNLLFSPYIEDKYRWLEYYYIINECVTKDNDFANTFSMFNNAYEDDSVDITGEEDDIFEEFTKQPERRNLAEYYHINGSKGIGVTSEMICDNAFLCDSSISEYIVPKNIEYIGNTAFAYCENLTKLQFKRKDTIFGKFPIIECNNLKEIIVPSGCIEYYANQLPYYIDIIVEDGMGLSTTFPDDIDKSQEQKNHSLKERISSWKDNLVSLIERRKERSSHDDEVYALDRQNEEHDTEYYYSMFRSNNYSFNEALYVLMKDNELSGLLVAFQLLSSQTLRESLGWEGLTENHIKQSKRIVQLSKYYSVIYSQMYSVYRSGILPIKGLGKKDLTEVTLDEFKAAFLSHVQKYGIQNDNKPSTISNYQAINKVDEQSEQLPIINEGCTEIDKKSSERTNQLMKSFTKKVTTYKYFWFLSILSIIRDNGMSERIDMEEVLKRMIVQAWRYVIEKESHFPSGDQIIDIIKVMWENTEYDYVNDNDIYFIICDELSNNASIKKKVMNLANNAPYRFLSPWIPFTTTSEVIAKSYKFENDCPYSVCKTEISINPDWENFLIDNVEELIKLVSDDLCKYLDIYTDEIEEGPEENSEIDTVNDDWTFVSDISIEKASKYFFNHPCRVVMSLDGYYLEVDNEYIKLGNYPNGMDCEHGSVWVKRPTVGTIDLRLVHVDMTQRNEIGQIREEGNIITFTTPDGEERTISFS